VLEAHLPSAASGSFAEDDPAVQQGAASIYKLGHQRCQCEGTSCNFVSAVLRVNRFQNSVVNTLFVRWGKLQLLG